MCNCKVANYNGQCQCNSSFEGLGTHVEANDLEALKSNFEDNLFREAFFASEEDFEGFLGAKKKQGNSIANLKPKKDLKKTLTDGADVLSKITGIFSGKNTVKGDYEGTGYNIGLGGADNIPAPPATKKKILGMPPMVFYTVLSVVVILSVIILLKVIKK